MVVHHRGPADHRLGRATAAVLVAILSSVQVISGTACRRRGATWSPVPATPQLTLAVAAGPGVEPALPAVVRMVAEQELRRAGLHRRRKASPVGVLTLILERRPHATHRLQLHLIGATRSLETQFDFGRCCAPAQVAELRRQIRLLVSTVGTASTAATRTAPAEPLWKGAPYSRDQLRNAVAAGVHWLLARAQRTGAFELSDLQQVFLILKESAADPALRRLAARVGPRLARRFLRLAPTPRATTSAEKLFDHAAGTYFAQRFGLTARPRYRQSLITAFQGAARWRLKRHAAPADPARELLDDLVDLYFPYKLGLATYAPYAEIVTRAARYPFSLADGETPDQLEDRIYLATHIVYVLSDFNESLLPERDLHRVVRFLERAAPIYFRVNDVETLGEVGDALKIVGRGYADPLLRRIVTLLLNTQNPDGSWGDMKDKDRYRRYHTTWTCFNGLLEFRFQKRGLMDPTIRAAWKKGYRAPPLKTTPPAARRPTSRH